MRLYSLEPRSLVHEKEFGKAGLQGNASSSCGLWPIIDVGQRIDLLKEALSTHRNAHFVIRLEKQLITCWSLVFLAGNFGSAFCSILGCKLLRHSWMITVLLTGGRELAAGFLVRLVWKHRNYYVFDGGTPNLSRVVSTCREDVQQWSIAGARGVSYLLALAPST